MNSTGNKLSGGVAMSFKVIALGLFVVSFGKLPSRSASPIDRSKHIGNPD